MIVYRLIHTNGMGLLNNQALNYDKLEDDEYFEIEDAMLGLQQPPSILHGRQITFAFTTEGLQKHRRLIELLSKSSKSAIRKIDINLNSHDIVWASTDGQLGLVPKKES